MIETGGARSPCNAMSSLFIPSAQMYQPTVRKQLFGILTLTGLAGWFWTLRDGRLGGAFTNGQAHNVPNISSRHLDVCTTRLQRA